MLGWLAAVLAMLIALALVLVEVTDAGQRRWWAAHPLTTDTVAGLLVLLVTVLVVNQVRHRCFSCSVPGCASSCRASGRPPKSRRGPVPPRSNTNRSKAERSPGHRGGETALPGPAPHPARRMPPGASCGRAPQQHARVGAG